MGSLLRIVLLGLAVLATPIAAQTPMPPVDVFKASPNYSTSSSRQVQYVVIHTVQGSWAGALSWFQNDSSQVSAHFTIAKDGRLGQSLTEDKVGWHAGNSTYNRLSIGIEHEGYVSDPNNYTDTMLKKSAWLTRYLCDKYGIPIDRQHIIGHVEVPGATHTDPGKYFPWSYYIQLVQNAGNGPGTPPPPPPPPAGSVRAVEVATGSLNVRTSAGGTILGQVSSGTRLVRIAEDSGWVKVWFEGRSAWVSEGYTRPVTSGTADQVTTAKLNVRSGPSTNYSVVGGTSLGQQYVRSGTSGSWRKIWYGRNQRWFHGGYTQSVPVGN